MPTGYTTWTVNPHRGIVKLHENLWRVEGKMANGVRRIMSLARLRDGRVVIHNAIAMEDEHMAAIDAWGEVAAIVIPNSFHRQDARIMHERYPKAKVYAPRAGMKAAAKATEVSGSYDEVPRDDTVQLRHIAGMKDREGVMAVRSAGGVSLVYCDSLMNMPKVGFPMGTMLHPTGRVSMPRVLRWFWVSNGKDTRADLERLAATDGLVRAIPGHGDDVVDDVAAKLKDAAALLG